MLTRNCCNISRSWIDKKNHGLRRSWMVFRLGIAAKSTSAAEEKDRGDGLDACLAETTAKNGHRRKSGGKTNRRSKRSDAVWLILTIQVDMES